MWLCCLSYNVWYNNASLYLDIRSMINIIVGQHEYSPKFRQNCKTELIIYVFKLLIKAISWLERQIFRIIDCLISTSFYHTAGFKFLLDSSVKITFIFYCIGRSFVTTLQCTHNTILQDYLNKLANYHRFISYWMYLGGMWIVDVPRRCYKFCTFLCHTLYTSLCYTFLCFVHFFTFFV